MAKVQILDTISTGQQSNMIGTPSSPGLVPVKWIGSIGFAIAVLDNGDTYLKFVSGSTNTRSGLTIRTTYWPVHPVLGYNDFTVSWASGNSKNVYSVSGSSTIDFGEKGTMTISGDSASWSYSAGYGLSEGQEVTHADMVSAGYIKTLSLSDWPEHNAVITLYALAMVLSNMPTVVNEPITLDAYPLTITAEANPKLFNYFPWERKIDGSFMSLNRGGSSTSHNQSGLFRMESGVYEPVLNSPGTGGKSDGMRYNDGWKKSPKSGQGAV